MTPVLFHFQTQFFNLGHFLILPSMLSILIEFFFIILQRVFDNRGCPWTHDLWKKQDNILAIEQENFSSGHDAHFRSE